MVLRPEHRFRRTCVGCRVRAVKTDLVRVVLVDGRVTLEQRGRMPGRGAWLHPDAACLDLAERRRAFVRALRPQGPVELSALRSAVEAQSELEK